MINLGKPIANTLGTSIRFPLSDSLWRYLWDVVDGPLQSNIWVTMWGIVWRKPWGRFND